MTTTQIIVLIILGLTGVGSSFRISWKSKLNENIALFTNWVIIAILVGLVGTLAPLANERKCPELKRVENVYKIKQ